MNVNQYNLQKQQAQDCLDEIILAHPDKLARAKDLGVSQNFGLLVPLVKNVVQVAKSIDHSALESLSENQMADFSQKIDRMHTMFHGLAGR